MAPEEADAVVYFADDDNTYTLELFEALRKTKTVGLLRVGLVGGLRYEGPETADGKMTGFHVGWRPERAYPMDMAGFAVHLGALLRRPSLAFDFSAKRGHLETVFLSAIEPRPQDAQVLDADCDHVLVWHTRTEEPQTQHEAQNPSSERILV